MWSWYWMYFVVDVLHNIIRHSDLYSYHWIHAPLFGVRNEYNSMASFSLRSESFCKTKRYVSIVPWRASVCRCNMQNVFETWLRQSIQVFAKFFVVHISMHRIVSTMKRKEIKQNVHAEKYHSNIVMRMKSSQHSTAHDIQNVIVVIDMMVCNQMKPNYMHHIPLMRRIIQEVDSLAWQNSTHNQNYTWIIIIICRVVCAVCNMHYKSVCFRFSNAQRFIVWNLKYTFNCAVAGISMHLVTDAKARNEVKIKTRRKNVPSVHLLCSWWFCKYKHVDFEFVVR